MATTTTRSLQRQILQPCTLPFQGANRIPPNCLLARKQLAQVQQCRTAHVSAATSGMGTNRIGLKSAVPKRKKAPSRAKEYFGNNTIVPQMSQAELKDVFSSELFIYRCDVTAGHMAEAMLSFDRLMELNILTEDDISTLAAQLHHKHRATKDRDAILPHFQLLMDSIERKKVPWHPQAAVHIISFLRDIQEFKVANTFWQWLYQQDERICDARVYGAAIELLVAQGESLENLEVLYQSALQKFSIRYDSGGGIHHKSTRVTLLQGITTARLLHGAWRAAYEAFDTCLRLHPTATPPRVYELFIHHRPAVEGYLVFLTACRAGCPLNPSILTFLTRAYERETHNPLGVIQMLYSHFGCRGEIECAHLNSLITALLNSVTPSPSRTRNEDSEAQLASTLKSVQETISVFRLYRIPPNVATYNTIISQGGRLRSKEMVHEGLAEMLRAKVEPTQITYRVLINAFGQLGDAAQVRESWQTLCDMYADINRQINTPKEPSLRDLAEGRTWQPKTGRDVPMDMKDWMALAKACIYTNQLDFLNANMQAYNHVISATIRGSISQSIKHARDDISKEQHAAENLKMSPPASPSSHLSILPTKAERQEQIHKQVLRDYRTELSNLRKIMSSSTIHDFTSMAFSHADAEPLSTDEIKQVYKRFTEIITPDPNFTNSSNPKIDGEDPAAMTGTGYTIGQLRFENWMTINQLLFLAEKRESQHVDSFVKGEPLKMIANAGFRVVASRDRNPVMKPGQSRDDESVRTIERVKAMTANVRSARVKELVAEAERKKGSGELVAGDLALLRAALVGGSGEDLRAKLGDLTFGPGGRQVGS